ncbi:MAG: hypothetical protein KKI16_08510, partial [Alphaproteobacteria bacterium]|nr:hypothetical protein [Alphaproteobacteria bacterium]
MSSLATRRTEWFKKLSVMGIQAKVRLGLIVMLGMLCFLALAAISVLGITQYTTSHLLSERIQPVLHVQAIVDEYREGLSVSSKVEAKVMPVASGLSALDATDREIERRWTKLKASSFAEDFAQQMLELERNRLTADAAKAKLRQILTSGSLDQLDYFVSNELNSGFDPLLITSQNIIDTMRDRANAQLRLLGYIYLTIFVLAACLMIAAGFFVHWCVRYTNRDFLFPLVSLARYANPEHRDRIAAKDLGLRRRDEIG